MPVTNYYSVNGVIIAEPTTGQSRLDYVTDALGSVIANVDQTLTVKSTARYKPYGAVLSETGTQPMYRWVGGAGYRTDGTAYCDIYVRSATYQTTVGRWVSTGHSRNRLSYAYVGCNPSVATDIMGTGQAQKSLASPGSRKALGSGTSVSGYASCFNLTKTTVQAKKCPGQNSPKTVYRIAGEILFCNYEETNIACPSVGSPGDSGFFAAWPYIKGNYNNVLHFSCPNCKSGQVTRACNHSENSNKYQNVPQVKCGLSLTVTATHPTTGKQSSVNVTIIDNGPARSTGDVIDLSQAAAKSLYDGIGLSWSGCGQFRTQDDKVQVTVSW